MMMLLRIFVQLSMESLIAHAVCNLPARLNTVNSVLLLNDSSYPT